MAAEAAVVCAYVRACVRAHARAGGGVHECEKNRAGSYCRMQIFSLSTSPLERKLLWFWSTIGVFACTLPFVLFKLPVLSKSLLRLEQSGYDQSGKLRLVMSPGAMFTKYEEEQRLLRKDQLAIRSKQTRSSPMRAMV